jgi:ribose transport system ATP-binding protein
MTLVRDLTVLENVLMPYAPANAIGIIRRRAAETKVRAHFARLRMDDIRLSDEERTLDLAVRQKIEIARALFRKPRILLLDEPTSTLTGRDVDWLGEIIEASGGETIVSSHRRASAPRCYADDLRNGRHIASEQGRDPSDAEVVPDHGRRSARPSRRGRRPRAMAARCSASKGSARPALRDATHRTCRRITGVRRARGWPTHASRLLRHDRHEDRNRPSTKAGGDRFACRCGGPISASACSEDHKTEALFLSLSGNNAHAGDRSRFVRPDRRRA